MPGTGEGKTRIGKGRKLKGREGGRERMVGTGGRVLKVRSEGEGGK